MTLPEMIPFDPDDDHSTTGGTGRNGEGRNGEVGDAAPGGAVDDTVDGVGAGVEDTAARGGAGEVAVGGGAAHGVYSAEVAAAREKTSRWHDQKMKQRVAAVEDGIAKTAGRADSHHAMCSDAKADRVKAAAAATAAEAKRSGAVTPGSQRGRTVPTVAYVIAVVVFIALDRVIDTSNFYLFRLSAGMTFWLGIIFPFTKALAAHLSGGFFRDTHNAICDLTEISAAEKALGYGSFVVGFVLCVLTGVLRAVSTGLIGGLLLGGVAIALYLGLTLLAYLHHSPLDAAVDKATRKEKKAARAEAKAKGKLAKTERVLASRIRGRRSLAERICSVYDAAIESALHGHHERTGRSHPPVTDPIWVAGERSLAEGRVPDDFVPSYQRGPAPQAPALPESV